MPFTRIRHSALWPAAVNVVLVVVVAGLATAAFAYPRPSAVPQRWQLEFEPGELRLYIDRVERRPYWFFTYKVTNETGANQIWAPRFTLFTDTGRIVESGVEVPARVTQDLLDLLSNPYLQPQNELIDDILQGPDHAREGLIVWPATDLRANEMSIFIAGISGDTAEVRVPGSGEKVILRKSLQIDYLVPGDALARGTAPADEVAQQWVFR